MSTRTYKISESICFRKTKENFGGLSNMAAGYSLFIHDIIIPTAEHLYQSCRFPNYPDLQAAIIDEKSPMKAKWIAKANINLTRPDWENVKFKIMQWVLEVKLSQNWDTFSQLLITTEDKCIVELTPKDKVWGAVPNGDFCVGVNALGRLLMQLRENNVKKIGYRKCVNPIDIPNFNLLDFPITKVCHEEYVNESISHNESTQLA